MNLITRVTSSGETVFFFEEFDVLIKFMEWQKQCVEDDVSYLIREAIPQERWDHYYGTCIGTIRSMALMNIRFDKTIPLFAHTTAMREYFKTLFDAFDRLDEDEALIVNMNGGWRVVETALTSDQKDYIIDAKQNLNVVQGTNVLILENDPTLDQWTVDNYTAPFSYITSLRKFSKQQLRDAFGTFANQIPQGRPYTLFVYTTGLDASQMEQYVDVACSAGFTVFVFVKSAGDQAIFERTKDKIISQGRSCDVYDPDDPQLHQWISRQSTK